MAKDVKPDVKKESRLFSALRGYFLTGIGDGSCGVVPLSGVVGSSLG